jgi:hypothetical protein
LVTHLGEKGAILSGCCQKLFGNILSFGFVGAFLYLYNHGWQTPILGEALD